MSISSHVATSCDGREGEESRAGANEAQDEEASSERSVMVGYGKRKGDRCVDQKIGDEVDEPAVVGDA